MTWTFWRFRLTIYGVDSFELGLRLVISKNAVMLYFGFLFWTGWAGFIFKIRPPRPLTQAGGDNGQGTL